MGKSILGNLRILCGTPAANYFAVHDQDVTCIKCKQSMGFIKKIEEGKISPCPVCGEKHIHSYRCNYIVTQD